METQLKDKYPTFVCEIDLKQALKALKSYKASLPLHNSNGPILTWGTLMAKVYFCFQFRHQLPLAKGCP